MIERAPHERRKALDGQTIQGLRSIHYGPVAKSGKAVSLQGTTASSNLARAFNVSAPTVALTTAEAEIRTAEAVRAHQPQYAAFDCELQEEIHSDLSQLPYRLPEVRQT